jgi:hypothetical protein
MTATDKADRVREIFAAYLANNRGFVEAAFSDRFSLHEPL